jgi:hypothetical protein
MVSAESLTARCNLLVDVVYKCCPRAAFLKSKVLCGRSESSATTPGGGVWMPGRGSGRCSPRSASLRPSLALGGHCQWPRPVTRRASPWPPTPCRTRVDRRVRIEAPSPPTCPLPAQASVSGSVTNAARRFGLRERRTLRGNAKCWRRILRQWHSLVAVRSYDTGILRPPAMARGGGGALHGRGQWADASAGRRPGLPGAARACTGHRHAASVPHVVCTIRVPAVLQRHQCWGAHSPFESVCASKSPRQGESERPFGHLTSG